LQFVFSYLPLVLFFQTEHYIIFIFHQKSLIILYFTTNLLFHQK
jgi:hypothetical protein